MLLVVCPAVVRAQRGRRANSSGAATANPQPIKGLVITFHGKLKELTKKTILIEADDAQIVTIRCSRKTKFLDNNREVKAFDIDLETLVTVDASEDNDLKLTALAIRVDPVQKKRTPVLRQ